MTKFLFTTVATLAKHAVTGKWSFKDTGMLVALLSLAMLPAIIIMKMVP